MARKKVLITTVPRESISKTVRYGREEVKTNTPEECFNAASSIEFINGMNMPNYATQILKENVPSIDILEYPSWEEFKQSLKANYDAIGISFWIYTSKDAVDMARMAKEAGVAEVWGGGHGINTPGIEKYFDRLFSSYGEYELKRIVDGNDLETFRHPVLISRNDLLMGEMTTGYLFSSRGCRFKCTYCSGSNYYNRIENTPLVEIKRLLDVYVKRGVSHISLVDQTFMPTKKHSIKVMEEIKKRKLPWSCNSRADVISGKIEELKTYGFMNVYMGIESMNALSLESVKKGQTPNQTVSVLRELEKNDTTAIATYMLCFDDDTSESIKEDIEKLNNLRALSTSVFYIATPFPGTVYWDECVEKNKIIDENWSHYDAKHLVREHPTISPEKAIKLLEYCVKNQVNRENNYRKYKIVRKWNRLERTHIGITNRSDI